MKKTLLFEKKKGNYLDLPRKDKNKMKKCDVMTVVVLCLFPCKVVIGRPGVTETIS